MKHYGVYVPGMSGQWQIIGVYSDVKGACNQAANILKSDAFERVEIANVEEEKDA